MLCLRVRHCLSVYLCVRVYLCLLYTGLTYLWLYACSTRITLHLPQCAEDLLTELGNEELFRRVLAVGYMSYQAFEKNRKKRLGDLQTKHHQGSCSQVQYFDIKADGFASGCCHKQRRYTEGEDAEGRKERRNREQDSYRIPCSFP